MGTCGQKRHKLVDAIVILIHTAYGHLRSEETYKLVNKAIVALIHTAWVLAVRRDTQVS